MKEDHLFWRGIGVWLNQDCIPLSFPSCLSFSLLTCRCVAVIVCRQSNVQMLHVAPPSCYFLPETRSSRVKVFSFSQTEDYCMFFFFYFPPLSHKTQLATQKWFSWFPMWSVLKRGIGMKARSFQYWEGESLWRYQLHRFKKERGLSFPPLFSVLW